MQAIKREFILKIFRNALCFSNFNHSKHSNNMKKYKVKFDITIKMDIF